MREGVSRDGHNLYPAHPYTSFAARPEADLQALYAFLMAEPAEAHVPPPTRLAAPFGERRLMRLWNALFLRGGPLVPDPARSASWNRGRELVEGLGHCSACHSPRNALGAERGGALHLTGGTVDGWDAPALAGRPAPRPLDRRRALHLPVDRPRSRTTASRPGRWRPWCGKLSALPEPDRRAMADYIARCRRPAGARPRPVPPRSRPVPPPSRSARRPWASRSFAAPARHATSPTGRRCSASARRWR